MATDNKTRIPLALARIYADKAIADLLPYVERIEIAGSIRRERPDVGDVELVCIPKPGPEPQVQHDLFGQPVGVAISPADQLFQYLQRRCDRPDDQWHHRGGFGVQNKLLLFCGFAFDVFTTTEANWGMTMFVRTGSFQWNIAAASALRRRNMKLQPHEGVLHKTTGEKEALADERRMFELLGWPFTDPPDRTAERARFFVGTSSIHARSGPTRT